MTPRSFSLPLERGDLVTLLEYTSPECSTGKHEPCAVVWQAVHAPDDEPYQGATCSCPCECHRPPPMRLVRLTEDQLALLRGAASYWDQRLGSSNIWNDILVALDGAGTEL